MNKPPTVLLVAADPLEFRGLLARVTKITIPNLPVRWSRICIARDGTRFVLVANGMGTACAARAVLAARSAVPVSAVVSFGFCGGLDAALEAGDIFVATKILAEKDAYPALAPSTARSYRSGILTTIDHVAQTASEKRSLGATGASAVDMEASRVAIEAAAAGLPFYCVRSITDTAAEDFVLDFNAALQPDGHLNAMRLLLSTLRRPVAGLRELFRLRERCLLASRNLGEFVADCQF
jgi:adenosylhomocysteine nucleosidase